MSFYNERIVKKPKKQYYCEVCHKPITGQHIYSSGIGEDGFYSGRQHEDCHKELTEQCKKCPDRNCCVFDYYECYCEWMKEKEQSK